MRAHSLCVIACFLALLAVSGCTPKNDQPDPVQPNPGRTTAPDDQPDDPDGTTQPATPTDPLPAENGDAGEQTGSEPADNTQPTDEPVTTIKPVEPAETDLVEQTPRDLELDPADVKPNYTTDSGRGAPSLADQHRPAAWILIDGQEGEFVDREGLPMLQWVINEPVCQTPTFEVVVYEDLVGELADLKFLLESIELVEPGLKVKWAMRALPGFTPEAGVEYSLTAPGANWGLRDMIQKVERAEADPLPPGRYMICAAVRGTKSMETGCLACSEFTVVADTSDAGEE
jgi:hypothetical protein